MYKKYDLIIIGGGTAGLVAAKYGVMFGARTLLVEAERIGGDCTWTGCVPSKSLLYAASLVNNIETAESMGFVEGKHEIKFQSIMNYVEKIIKDIYEEEKPEVLEKQGIDVVIGEASFISPKAIEIKGQIYKSKKFIIATGAKPIIPQEHIEGLENTPFLTTDSIFGIPELPQHLIIIGAGPIGCELGQAFKRLGSEVTIVDMVDRLIPKDDILASDVLQKTFTQEGIKCILSKKVDRVKQNAKGEIEVFTNDGKKVVGSDFLLAVGRAPNFSTLNLEVTKVKIENNIILVNDKLRTTQKSIFAAGDCVSQYQFTHIAGYQGFIAARNALLPLNSIGLPKLITWVTFTDPEVAFVGRHEFLETNENTSYIEEIFYDSNVDRALTDSKSKGFLKLISNKKGKIIAVTVVSPRAGEIIHEWLLALNNNVKLGSIATAVHAYPTYSMGSMQLAGEMTEKSLAKGFIGNLIRWISKAHRLFT
ncbi:MAG: dihydrolipoyl dehydrogenase family protein [Candidatus Heimdallarchaeaceae archaeon]